MLSVSMIWTPEWTLRRFNGKQWQIINLTSTLVAVTICAVYNLYYTAQQMPIDIFLSVSWTSLGYLSTISLATDTLERKVDRHLLQIAIIVTTMLGIGCLWGDNSLPAYLLLIVLSYMSFVFIPWGESDARTLSLMIATLYPVYGLAGINIMLSFTFIGAIIYAFIYTIKLRSIKKIFTTKVSMPLVPFLLLSGLVVCMTFSYFSTVVT